MAAIGKILGNNKIFNFKWSIDNFFSLSEETGKSFSSPPFLFADESWYLCIYPNGCNTDSEGYICLVLHKNSPYSGIDLVLTLGLEVVASKEVEALCTGNFNDESTEYGACKFFKRSLLLENKSKWVSSDILTFVCTLTCYKSCHNADSIKRAKCTYCKVAFDVKDISSHEDVCLNNPITCPMCNDVVKLSKWSKHKCQMRTVKGANKLIDFEAILKRQEYSDITIKVKDKDFHLHRIILAGHNPVFHSMCNVETKEKTTDVMSIDDCEPHIFEFLIGFIYTGKIPVLSYDNVCPLYEAANKFQEDQLKTECSSFMRNNISIDNFVDFIILAIKHDDKELLQVATDFFCTKMNEIIRNVKWQSFMREYSSQANELLIKFADYNAKN